MNNPNEQFIATQQANIQAIEGLTTQAFAGFEKLVELNMAASKALLGESFNHVQSVMAAKDAQEMLSLQSNFFKPMAEKSAAYAQHVQTIVADSGAEISKTVEASTAEVQKNFTGAVENMSKNAPMGMGTDSAVAAFKNALTAGQSAFESAQSSAKQAVETAQSNFNTVSTQTADAVKKATKSV